jgi:class 3 adenylate cyclase
MNKYSVSSIQDYLEEQSCYFNLIARRFVSEDRYKESLLAIEQGLVCLGIPKDTIKAFQNRSNLIIELGHKLTEYEGYELPLFIGHKKKGMPIPAALAEKCPQEIISLIEKATNRKHVNEFSKELQQVSLAPDIFLTIHKSLIGARVETLLSDLLSDVERLGFTSMKDAIEKIPSIYLYYLPPTSLAKLFRKLAGMLRDVKTKLEEELKNIDLYSVRIREQLEGLYLETNQGLREIIENDVVQGADTNVITQKVSNLFSRLDRLFLGNIYHLKDYQKKKDEILDSLKQEEDLKYYAERRSTEPTKPISDVFHEYMYLHKFGPLTKEENKLFVKSLTLELEEIYRKKSRSVTLLKKFEKRSLISVDLDIDALIDMYNSVMKRAIVPDYVGQCFFNLVNCLPPADNEAPRLKVDLANLKTVFLTGRNVMELRERSTGHPREISEYANRYRKCVTILVYDIRGSSYMGIKLNDAVKEQRIKHKFAKEMAQIVKRYDGFLLKDTGDGGLVWFSENSGSLYNYLYTESVTGKGTKLRYSICSGGECDIIPAADAARRAILCARDIVLRAEEFIRANFVHYREWFADVAERTLELDGITYALLPPEFKSLFRVGVGIASGVPDRDVIFAPNSYGDPDLVGPVLSDANLYSRERQPGRSVMICDLPTLVNLILNADNFDYPVEENNFDKYCKILEDLRGTTHGYTLADLKVSVMPKGVHLLGELNKNKAIADARIDEVIIDEHCNIYDNESKRIKMLYEILTL